MVNAPATMKNPMVSSPEERPLSGAAKLGLILSAALAITLFYTFATLSVLLLLILLVLELGVFILLLRFGLSRVMVPFLERHTKLVALSFRSFWIRKRTKFQVEIEEKDAPNLFAILERLSQRLQVRPPRQVQIEMNAAAWVLLKGVRRGADSTTLGLGYDLVACLTVDELEAVLAHEMSHAKLVRRGLKHWLTGGVNRAATLTTDLQR
jgi:Zn-dependent protease with chaperone function